MDGPYSSGWLDLGKTTPTNNLSSHIDAGTTTAAHEYSIRKVAKTLIRFLGQIILLL